MKIVFHSSIIIIYYIIIKEVVNFIAAVIYYLIEVGEHRHKIYRMIVPSQGIILGG